MKFSNFLKPTKTKRTIFFILGDIILLSFSFLLAFFIRFEFSIPSIYFHTIIIWVPWILIIKLLSFHSFKLYSFSWNFVGLKEFFSIGNACFFSLGLVFIANMLTHQLDIPIFIPRSVLFIDFILSLLLVGNFRLAKRLYIEAIRSPSTGKRTLIVGAGPTGERLVREFRRSDKTGYLPIAIVDDDPNKLGTRIHDVKVIGNTAKIPEIIADLRIQAAIIAITTAKHIVIKKLFDLLSDCGIDEIKVFPHLSQLPERTISITDIHDIDITDLLYRDTVQTDFSMIRKNLQSKVILVTGAAGSIGSEIISQLLLYYPNKIIVFDIDETDIYNLLLEIKNSVRIPTVVVPFVGDVRKNTSLKKVFETYKPQIVFHAAAYKHVPMMELFPEEALETNFVGTYRLAKQAVKHKVECFVNISTDKAVNPTSVMGASKRLAEIVCTSMNEYNGTRFMSVRFGNVLGSRGSVVPVFLKQINDGGPITVTHHDVQRFFMTIPEAVSLVFQASTMGKGGEVFVLDMGKPVKILKIAEDLIKLNRMVPYTDIKIDFVGLRPGEKMFEELLTAEEGITQTSHEKIFIARNISQFNERQLSSLVEEIITIIQQNGNIKLFLEKNVPYFKKSKT